MTISSFVRRNGNTERSDLGPKNKKDSKFFKRNEGTRVTIQSSTDRSFILVFRLLMAWTFLYAASHQVFNPKYTDVYAVLATPAIDPVLTFLVS
jgi:hypothetical protein